MDFLKKCVLCSDEFSLEDLEAHITADHFLCLPYECEKCKFAKFPTEFMIKRHYEEDHGLTEYFIRYRISPEINSKRKQIQECLEQSLQSAISNTDNILIDSTVNNSIRQPTSKLEEPFSNPSNDIIDRTLSPTANFEYRNSDKNNEINGSFASTISQIFENEGMNQCDYDRYLLEKYYREHLQMEKQPEQMRSEFSEANLADTQSPNNFQKTEVNAEETFTSDFDKAIERNQLISKVISTSTARPTEIQCKVCNTLVNSRPTSLMYHVNVKHLKLPLYICMKCDEVFLWNRPAAVRHAQQKHGDGSLVQNNTEKYFPLLNQCRREYFDQIPSKRFSYLVNKNLGTLPQTTMSDLPSSSKMTSQLGSTGIRPSSAQSDYPEDSQIISGSTQFQGSMNMTRMNDEAASWQINSIKCSGCKEMVKNKEWILLNHVNTKHLKRPLYKCSGCDQSFLWYIRSYAVRHVKFYHSGDESLLVDHRKQFRTELKTACANLFKRSIFNGSV